MPCCSGDAFLLFLLVATIGEKRKNCLSTSKKTSKISGATHHLRVFPHRCGGCRHLSQPPAKCCINYTSPACCVHTKKTQWQIKTSDWWPSATYMCFVFLFSSSSDKSASLTWGHNSWQAMGNNWQRSYRKTSGTFFRAEAVAEWQFFGHPDIIDFIKLK